MRRIITVAVVSLLLVGCGGRSRLGTVSGTLTYKGRPINGAALLLYPDGGGEPFQIPVTQEGTFRTSDVPPGEYTVVVEGTAGNPGPPTQGMSKEKAAEAKEKFSGMTTPPTIAFPNRYKSVTTSNKKVTVVAGEQKMDIDLPEG
jgi:hypothetical protein